MSTTTTTEVLADPIPLVDLAWQHTEVVDEVTRGIAAVMSTGAFINGPDVREFEREMAEYLGIAHCLGVGNGTDALELAIRAAGVPAGSEIIVPANTFIASAEAVVRAGCRLRLVDCDPVTQLIDVEQTVDAVGESTGAVLPVHLFGQIAPLEVIESELAKAGVPVIEDAAQAQGASRNGRNSGQFGVAGGTSFYPGKNLGAYGDAGAVLTDDAEIAARVRALRNHGGEAKYEHSYIGTNSRLDTMQAVVLRAKLRRLEGWNEQRRAAADRYAELLADVAEVTLPTALPGNVHVWHLYVVEVDNRDDVLATLNTAGIGAGIHYPMPIHQTVAFAESLGHGAGAFPVAERLASRILSLPIFPGITAAQQERVAEVLTAAVRGMSAEVFVHPLGVCETDQVGEGTRIWAFAHVLPGASVGAGCNICDHAFIEGGAIVGDRVTVKNAVLIWDGVTIGDDVFIGPNAIFTNDFVPRAHVRKSSEEFGRTLVHDGASIGANATVVCGVAIGADALVGAGAVVTKDVPAHALVVGNPARQVGWVCRCGGRLDDGMTCPECGTKHRQRSDRTGLEAAGSDASAPIAG